MKRILVPCDFSPTAKEAYTFALNLAGLTDAEVMVVKAIDFPFMYETAYAEVTYFDPGFLLDLQRDAEESFLNLKKGHKRQEKVTLHVSQGSVTQVIRNAIKNLRADLVVMGTNGSSGFKEYMIGSNTEKIVRFSPVPVFAIRKSVLTASIQNIVVPTTLELNQHELMGKIKELQELFNAKLHLLVVNTPIRMARTEDRKAAMAEFAKFYDLSNYTMNIRDDYNEEDAILSFTKEINADMIAMGTHARKGLSHLFMGSISEDVVNHGFCPIWSMVRNNEGTKG